MSFWLHVHIEMIQDNSPGFVFLVDEPTSKVLSRC